MKIYKAFECEISIFRRNIDFNNIANPTLWGLTSSEVLKASCVLVCMILESFNEVHVACDTIEKEITASNDLIKKYKIVKQEYKTKYDIFRASNNDPDRVDLLNSCLWIWSLCDYLIGTLNYNIKANERLSKVWGSFNKWDLKKSNSDKDLDKYEVVELIKLSNKKGDEC